MTAFNRHIFLSLMLIFFLFQQILAEDEAYDPGNITEMMDYLNKTDNNNDRICTLLDIAWFYMNSSSDSALIYSRRSYRLAKSYKDIEKTASALSAAYAMANDYKSSIKYGIEAFQAAQKYNHTEKYAILLSNIGMCFLEILDCNQAMNYFEQALEYSHDYDSRYLCYVNIAQVYGVQHKFNESRPYFEKALKLAEDNNNKRDLAMIYNRFGEQTFAEEKYKESREFYEKALQMTDSNDYYLKAECLKGIVFNCIQEGNYNEALKITRQIDTLARFGGFMSLMEQNYELISKIYDSLNQPSLALYYYKNHVLYYDSTLNMENSKQISFLQSEFDMEQKEMQIWNLEQKIFLRKKLNYLYIILCLLIFAVLSLIIKNIRNKSRRLAHDKEVAKKELYNEREKAQVEKLRLLQLKEKESLDKQTLELALEEKHREILTHALQINQQKEVLTSIQNKIVDILHLKSSESIIHSVRNLSLDIKNRINIHDNWEQVKMHFEKIHPDFFNRLRNEFPTLTTNELKLCAYTRLQFSSREISRLLNVNLESVQMSRYRLKKKMSIPEEVNFIEYIQNRD